MLFSLAKTISKDRPGGEWDIAEKDSGLGITSDEISPE
jgi:hypothetical protein